MASQAVAACIPLSSTARLLVDTVHLASMPSKLIQLGRVEIIRISNKLIQVVIIIFNFNPLPGGGGYIRPGGVELFKNS